MRKLLVVDTETAGLHASRHSILSFAAVIYQDGSITGEFHTLVAEPTLCVENVTDEQRAEGVKDAFEVNGIKADDLIGAPTPWLVVQQFVNWLQKNEMYGQQTLVAHKVDFDVAFLKRLWLLAGADFEKQFGHRHLCTQSAALLLDYAGRLNLPGRSASLDNVAEALGCGKREGRHHNALEDAKLCAQVLRKLLDKVTR
jgi:DNA polymerase III epsilon subunit-like protein